MPLSKAEIEKIAHLARLQIDAAEVAAYTTHLSNILSLVAKLQATNTENIAPLAHPLDTTQRLRPDTVTEPNQRELFLSIAPSSEAGLYLVPKVIE